VLSTFDKRTYELRTDGSIFRYWKNGNTMAEYRKDGTPSLIHTQDLIVVRGVRGEVYFEAQLSGGTRVVGWGAHDGYVERPLPRGDGHYVQRTYSVRGLQTTAVFHIVDYNGMTLATYVPERYYGSAFYAWAERNWPRHMHYIWPWLNEKWAAPYRLHFGREYPSFGSWIVDFLVAGMLQTELVTTAQAATSTSAGSFYINEDVRSDDTPGTKDDLAPNSPVISDMDAKRLRGYQFAATTESSEWSKGSETIPPMVAAPPVPQKSAAAEPINSPAMSMQLPPIKEGNYIVSNPLSFNTLGCSLNEGSTLHVLGQSAETTVYGTVVTSKPGDCEYKTSVPLSLAQFYEMDNDDKRSQHEAFRIAAQLKGIGLPALPVGAIQSMPQGKPIPTLTTDVVGQIAQQAGRAAATERAIAKDATAVGVDPNKRVKQ
jgi:hypothetical protein